MDMVDTRETIKIQPDLRQLRGLLKVLNTMEKEANVELKDDVQSITMWMAGAIEQAGYAHPIYPKQAAIVARTVKGNRDRLPNVTIGGGKGRVSGGANAGQLLFGNEFGGDRNAFGNKNAFPNGGYRFPARTERVGRGNRGYWIFPTLRANQPEITRKWITAVEKVLDNWNYGPGGIK
jgi:hypothetical protein